MSELDYRGAIRTGLIYGVIALSVSAIGMVEAFNGRDIITGVLTLGQVILFIAVLIGSYLFTHPGQEGSTTTSGLVAGLILGFFTSLPLVLLIMLATVWHNIRGALVNVTPGLIEILTFDLGRFPGAIVLVVVMSALGAVGAGFHLLPKHIERPILNSVFAALAVGLFADIFRNILQGFLTRPIISVFFGNEGITPLTAGLILAVVAGLTFWWNAGGKERIGHRIMDRSQQSRRAQLGIRGLLIALILALPWILGIYLTNIVDQVGIFILMGLGLNIVVGFAGLLDLGYVAFYAIGAYTVGLLTSTGDLGMGLSFWIAIPLAVGAAATAGILLGVPVLRMRGDYLAIVTLGFGEIIRVLVASDLLKPIIGGAQGIIKIGGPEIFGFQFVQPQHYYYVILAGCLLAVFVASRLRDARLGRQWMALREDEDVAEAIGINLVKTKLLAFSIGALFGGLAGGIFAARLNSIFPNSFALLISINVLSLIIVGGIGSLPGVALGALVLVGMPELLSEFNQYKLLLYGAVLVAMMLFRPEGLWPSPIRKRELHAAEIEEMAHNALLEEMSENA